jgi:transposase
MPIAAAVRHELLAGSYIQADETPVGVQMHDGRGKNHQAWLWQYGRPGGSVVFDFRLGRGRERPKRFLGQFEGILQSDGYAAYENVGGPKVVHAACWAHSRRKFLEAVKLHPEDRVATQIVWRIDELFSIDAQAREQRFDYTARHALRLERARPLLDIIKQQTEAARAETLPSSALGKTAGYTLALWRKLTRFLEYPEMALSNNLAENHAPAGDRSEELDPCGQPAGRAEGRRHFVHRGKLPPHCAYALGSESCGMDCGTGCELRVYPKTAERLAPMR